MIEGHPPPGIERNIDDSSFLSNSPHPQINLFFLKRNSNSLSRFKREVIPCIVIKFDGDIQV